MGVGNSSKPNSEIERNKRLREFEEEFDHEDESDNVSLRSTQTTHAPKDNYFSQFMNPQRRLSVASVSPFSSESLDGSIRDMDQEVSYVKDKEVEEAIAELEETFRSLTPDLEEEEGRDDRIYSVNAQDCLTLTTPTSQEVFLRSQSCGPLNISPVHVQGGQQQALITPHSESKERKGTPAMAMGPTHMYNRHRRPLGLAHLSKSSSGGIAVGGLGNKGGDLKGFLSAPPGVSGSKGTNAPLKSGEWKPPDIEGFDVEKFREANRPRPPVQTSQRGEDEKRRSSTPGQSTSYTNEELELLRTLEREVY